MYQEILACLDGSSLAKKILPLARILSVATRGKLVLFRVFGDIAELSAEEESLRDTARHYGAELRWMVSQDPVAAIIGELEPSPHTIAALTTHGRSAWVEAIIGSVALRVIRESKRPVIIFRPLEDERKSPTKIDIVTVALDGSRFSEQILPYAVKIAQSMSAQLYLLQVLSVTATSRARNLSDAHEASYLHRKANEIKTKSGVDVQWEVLHGNPAEAICTYVNDTANTLLAMTTHARSALERTVLGSVAGACLRHAGVPLLLYWHH